MKLNNKILGLGLILLISIGCFLFYNLTPKTIAVFSTCKQESCFGVAGITLKSNNSFKYMYGGCSPLEQFDGTWTLNLDTLTLDGRDSMVIFDQTKFIIGKDSTLSAIDTTKANGYSWKYYTRETQ